MCAWKKSEADFNIVNLVENQPEEFTFICTKQINAKDGEVYELMEVKNLAGVTEHYFMSGHLKYLLEKSKVATGDKIRVTYLGKVEADVLVDGKKKATQVNKYSLELWAD